MKKYLRIYREFLSTSLAEAASFRLHFILLIFMDLVFFATTLASIQFLYNHVAEIGSFSREEFLFFATYMLTLDQLHMAFVSESFWVLSMDIRTGQLDFWLLRPANLYFSLFLRHIRIPSMVTLIAASLILAFFGSQVLSETWQWLALPILLIFSLILLVLTEILLCSAMFYVVEGTGINFLRLQMQAISRWPDFIYKPLIRRIFTFLLPLVLIGSGPVHFLLNPRDPSYLLIMGLWIPILILAIRFSWKRALKHYESASS